MIFTRIFLSANSLAATLAILFKAALVAAYILEPKAEAVALVDDVNTTEPPFAICGIKCCKVKYTPFTLVLNCASNSASVACSIGAKEAIPAFKNNTSIFLPLAATFCSNSAILFKFDVSETRVLKFGLLITASAFFKPSAFRPVIHTFAPASINAFAVASPIPLLPPVTTTFLFLKFIVIYFKINLGKDIFFLLLYVTLFL